MLPLKKGEITLTPEKLIINDGFGKIRRNKMFAASLGTILGISLTLIYSYIGRYDALFWMWLISGIGYLGALLMFLFFLVAPTEVKLTDIRYGRFVNMPSGRFLSLKLTNSHIRRVGPIGMEELELKPALEELGVMIK